MIESTTNPIDCQRQAIIGCLVGTAVGDALGLPYEGLSRRRGIKLLATPNRHRFFFRKGMVSDDTEHSCMVANAMLLSQGDSLIFDEILARQFRYWLATLPAGIGLATLRSIMRLWRGLPPSRSGVFSAGNGPAMRAAIIGVYAKDERELIDFTKLSTRLTHTDPKAEYGAIAVALAARSSATHQEISGDTYLSQLKTCLGASANEFLELLDQVIESVRKQESTELYAESIGLSSGVSGYVYHTVPVALHAWLSHQNEYRQAVMSVIQCGGDTDTTAAIVGGIVGARTGVEGIPPDWIEQICEWPLSIRRIEQLGNSLYFSVHGDKNAVRNHWPHFWKRLLRNFVFSAVVLFHGFRRLLPPY